MTGCPLVLPTTGVICGKKIPDSFGRCKQHTRKVACPFLLPGDKACGVALDEGWQNLDPTEHAKHPHHAHYKVRMVVIDPIHRLCQECQKTSTHLEGYCDLHAPQAQQARREMLAEGLAAEAQARGTTVTELTRQDRAEILEVVAAEVVARRGSYDVTNFVEIDNPYAELYKLAGQTVAWKDALAEKISEMAEAGFTDDKGGEQIKADVQLFTAAMIEARQVLTAIAKLDVEERMVRIAESQAMMIADVLGRVLDSIGLSHAIQLQARAAVAERLRIVGAGTAQAQPLIINQ